MEDLSKAIEFVEKFLDLCKSDDKPPELKAKENKFKSNAYKRLAELHSKLGNSTAAISNLEALLGIGIEDQNKQGQAEATLKLGLLNYEEGILPISIRFLGKHFDLTRTLKDQNLKEGASKGAPLIDGSVVDISRVNLGIAQANQQIDKYFKLIMTDVHSVINYLDDPKAENDKK
mmetsp:Transcript_867/g.863  ORF Transcript_867/g.863 Transcript_867/m.863 type:complete len:175 (+) Transcript_867:934-1458(+)